MKISYTLLILIAGSSLASAGQLPKEGTYDYTSCRTGTSSEMKLPEGKVAMTQEFSGVNVAKTPGGLFDNSTFRCIGSGYTHDVGGKQVWTGRNVCEAVDTDGDHRWASFVADEDGKATRTNIGGTGKYDGMVLTNMVVEEMPTSPALQPGRVQGCTHQTGNYKLK